MKIPIPSGKTKVVMLRDDKTKLYGFLKKGDECYLQDVHPTASPLLFIVVRLSDGKFGFASVFDIKAIAINDNK